MTASSLRFFLFTFALLVGGCHVGRYDIAEPGKSQSIRAESGDRFFMDLEEDSTSGRRWEAHSNDQDVDVIIDHESGKAKVTIRVRRGYDGPSTLTFTYGLNGKKPEKTFAITLFRRTGNYAFWE